MKVRFLLFTCVFIIAFSLLLFACGGGGGGGGTAPTPDPSENLDTSFLETDEPGTYSGTSSLVKKNNVYELTSGELISVDETQNTVTIVNPSKTYAVDDIIIGDNQTRFAYKVISVAYNDSELVLGVENVYIDDIFESGSVSFNVTPDWSSGSFDSMAVSQKSFSEYFTPNRSSKALNQNDVSSEGIFNLDDQELFVVTVKDENSQYQIDWENSSLFGHSIYQTDPDELKRSVVKSDFTDTGRISAHIKHGSLKLVPTVRGEYSPYPISTTCQMDMIAILDATIEVTARGSVVFEIENKLLPKITVPVTIPATPPIYLDIEIEIPANFKLESYIEGSATFSLHSEYAIKIQMDYNDSDGFTVDEQFDELVSDKAVSLGVEGGLESTLSIKPKVTVKLYKIIGPFFELEPYIKGKMTIDSLCGKLQWVDNEHDLYLGIAGRAGLALNLFAKSYEWETPDLFNKYYSWDLMHPVTVDCVPTLNGEYVVAQFMDDEVNTGGYLLTNRMQFTFNGDGTATYSMLSSSTNDSDSGEFTYSVGSNGQLTTNVNSDTGLVSSDGNFFMLWDTDGSDDVIHTMIGIKKSSSMSNSKLNGEYVACKFEEDTGLVSTARYGVTFYGDGNANPQILSDSRGFTETYDFSYTIAADGTYCDDGSNIGIVDSDGQIGFAVDTDNSDSEISMRVLIKNGTNLSNALLSGSYTMVFFGQDHIGTTSEVSFTYTMGYEFDGNGNGTATLLSHSQDEHLQDIGTTEIISYSVSNDGSLSIIGSITQNGIVKSNGQSLLIIDTDANDNELSFGFGIMQ